MKNSLVVNFHASKIVLLCEVMIFFHYLISWKSYNALHITFPYTHGTDPIALTLFSKSSTIKYVVINKSDVSRVL